MHGAQGRVPCYRARGPQAQEKVGVPCPPQPIQGVPS